MLDFLTLTKPRILLGNLITFIAGFFLPQGHEFVLSLFLYALIGLSCIMAAGCIFNNYLDIEIDSKMKRTSTRSLVTGKIKIHTAVLFGALLLFLGSLILYLYTNPLTFFLASVGFFVYVFIYTPAKPKTKYATILGTIAGGIPPLVGYTAVTDTLDRGAWLFFMLMVFWQMPHFYAIALLRLEDYKAANIPITPLAESIQTTKIEMFLYISLLIPTTFSLFYLGYTGIPFASISLLLGGLWLYLAYRGFCEHNTQLWSRHMLRYSLIYITAISCIIPFEQ